MTTPAGSPDPAPGSAASEATRRSLLVRIRSGEPAAWDAFATLYRPLMVGWLRAPGGPAGRDRRPGPGDPPERGAEPAPVRPLGPGRGVPGVAADDRLPPRPGLLAGERPDSGDRERVDLKQLEDPDSELARRWDEEHDRYVFRCLLDLVGQEFEPATVRAFRRLVLDEAPGAVVADELGVSVGAVYVARSRVLQRIRQEAEGLID